ncbi:MAG: single-stranded-DNA-specific exonuclease RecJ [Pseudobutyrivibrio sp.]|nr:single-stranded-DNA-specific exonuclease RecJ [Pseudobutyrivibrio sp.]
MAKWLMHAKRADFKDIANKLNIDQVIARIMVNRGLNSLEDMEQFIHPNYKKIAGNPNDFKDMSKAVDMLKEAIESGEKIRIIGDYDVDGIMSTYILFSAILRCNGQVDYAIPHRVEDGYGVNPNMVRAAYDEGVRFIITCDNGIASKDAVQLGKKLGMTFVITDHHDIPFVETDGIKQYILPAADAIVNPKQSDCGYLYKNICGAQVAWKLVCVLYEAFGISETEADSFLQYAAFACICDVMELTGENRAVVSQGLKELSNTENIGLDALIRILNLKDKDIKAFHVGFVLGPCFNASGRLDTATRAIELLLEKDENRAFAIAGELVSLNEQRKTMTLKGIERAAEIIENQNLAKDPVLVIYDPLLHESLAGIVAGKIKEKYYHPTIVITDGEECAKGSGRSIEGYHMYDELTKVKELFTKYGGHPMAAGLSISSDKIDELRIRLNDNCTLEEDALQEIIRIDVPMPLEYISEELVKELELLEPFGNGNPKPVFAINDAKILRASYMGKEKQYLRMVLETELGTTLSGVLFSDVGDFAECVDKRHGVGSFDGLISGKESVELDLTYYPQINEYKGNRSLQIVVDKYK